MGGDVRFKFRAVGARQIVAEKQSFFEANIMLDPSAVTVDKKGYLYVTNTESSVVVEFEAGSITPSKREISKGLFEPEGTAYSPPLLP
jgi:DNA-binding beta-propeller fold protein YncE